MSLPALQAQAAAALDLVVHVVRDRGGSGVAGRRRVATIQLLDRDRDGLRMVPAVEFTAQGRLRELTGFPALTQLLAR
ncbi:hypothetical protein [Enemella evansiae]|uniref:hypothetical protein n=1 Tax=Enemella evansiae TaxID=2016499 RepID=UPI002B4BCC31|nr:hypothetical protein [Enemella evansiae]